MSAATLIRAAMDAGVALKFEGGKIKACGHADAVSLWAPRLREHKAALIEALGRASNDPEPPTTSPPPAPAPPPRKPQGQRYQEWVTTWKPLADAYHAHHFGCPVCVAAGKGYGLHCGVGAALWTAYTDQSAGGPP